MLLLLQVVGSTTPEQLLLAAAIVCLGVSRLHSCRFTTEQNRIIWSTFSNEAIYSADPTWNRRIPDSNWHWPNSFRYVTIRFQLTHLKKIMHIYIYIQWKLLLSIRNTYIKLRFHLPVTVHIINHIVMLWTKYKFIL